MKNVLLKSTGPRPAEQDAKRILRAKVPLPEGLTRLDHREVKTVLSLFCGKRRAKETARTFLDARDDLQEMGATLEMVESEGSMIRMVARYEYPTLDRVMDAELEASVSGMGFKLTLRSEPVVSVPLEERYEMVVLKDSFTGKELVSYEPLTIRTYVITETDETSDVRKAATTASNLLKLLPVVDGLPMKDGKAKQEAKEDAQLAEVIQFPVRETWPPPAEVTEEAM